MQLLAELDGLTIGACEIIAATNRPDILDDASCVPVDLIESLKSIPEEDSRHAILSYTQV